MTIGTPLRAAGLPGSTLLIGYPGIDQAYRAFCQINDHDFCSTCRMCKRILADAHPDFVLSRDDSIDEARRLGSLVLRRKSEVRQRVIVIDGSRSEGFQNAILKTLEEPGANNHVMWFVDRLDRFLITVISRSQVSRFAKPIETTVNAEAFGRVTEYLDFVRTRNIIGIISAVDSWEDGKAVLRELIRHLHERSVREGNKYDDALTRAEDLYTLVTMSRPPANGIMLLTNELIRVM